MVAAKGCTTGVAGKGTVLQSLAAEGSALQVWQLRATLQWWQPRAVMQCVAVEALERAVFQSVAAEVPTPHVQVWPLRAALHWWQPGVVL